MRIVLEPEGEKQQLDQKISKSAKFPWQENQLSDEDAPNQGLRSTLNQGSQMK